MDFCGDCGSKLKSGRCPKCEVNKVLDVKEATEKKAKIFDGKSIKAIAAINILIIAIGGVLTYKSFEAKKQMEYEVEAVIHLENEKFIEAKEVMEKYKGNNPKLIDLKDINNLFLELEDKVKANDVESLNEFVVKFKDTENWKYYESGVVELKELKEKTFALKELEERLPKYINEKNITKARGLISRCKNYKLSQSEKKNVEKAEKEIGVLSKEVELVKAKNDYMERYKRLDNKYYDNYYIDSYKDFNVSEAELVIRYGEIADEWQDLVDDIWSDLPKFISGQELEKLKKEQIAWEKERKELENSINDIGQGGNQFAQNRNINLASMSQERAKELIDKYLS